MNEDLWRRLDDVSSKLWNIVEWIANKVKDNADAVKDRLNSPEFIDKLMHALWEKAKSFWETLLKKWEDKFLKLAWYVDNKLDKVSKLFWIDWNSLSNSVNTNVSSNIDSGHVELTKDKLNKIWSDFLLSANWLKTELKTIKSNWNNIWINNAVTTSADKLNQFLLHHKSDIALLANNKTALDPNIYAQISWLFSEIDWELNKWTKFFAQMSLNPDSKRLISDLKSKIEPIRNNFA